MRKSLLAVKLGLLIFSGTLNAQNIVPKTCGADYVMEELFNSQPGLREIYNSKFLELSERAKLFGRNAITNEVIEIPVVVHVLEDGNSAYYKSDQDIIDWINRANSIFDGTANDILNTNQGGTEIPVRLVLAKRTPTNQATNGIVRYDLSTLENCVYCAEYVANGVKYYSNSAIGIPHSTLVAGRQWSTSSYYNVYINNKFEGVDGYRGGLMGFAYSPGGTRDYSFMVTANLKSTDTTFAHEMMHAFGIKHVFEGGESDGSTCASEINDGIDDTQITRSLLSAWPVPTNNDFNDCAGENYDGVQHNMMNYGSALNRFTPGQRNLAYQTIENLRGSMKTSLGAVPVTNTNNIPVPLQNCEITGSNQSSLFYIQNVEFGSVVSKPGYVNINYVDYTLDNNINTGFYSTFFEGETFQLKVSSDWNIGNRRKLAAYIDYNNNGEFEANEMVVAPTLVNSGETSISVNITIPTGVVKNKNLRFRLVSGIDNVYTGYQDVTYGACDYRKTGQVFDYSIIVKDVNTIWENGAWSNGIPTLEKEAIIKDNLVITTGELVAKKLTVEAGSLTLNTGTILKLENELVNELTADKVIFDNGAYLMQNNATALNVGNVTYKRNSTPIHRLETLMWSSPVDGQKIGEISPETLGNRFTQYDEPSNSWVAININNDFQVGEMVAFRAPNTFDNHISPTQPGRIFEGKFIGTPFNGEYSVPVTARNSSQGFNGVGNPYASPISLEAFLNAPANAVANIEALYFWTREKKIVNGVYEGGNGSNWITYNKLGSTDDSRTQFTINAAQGFIAKVRNQGTLKFDNSMRTVSQDNISFRNNTVSKYWLELLKEDRKVNSILIGNIAGSTKGYESNLDAKPMEASEGIFSLIDNDVFVIQARGEQIDENDRIALKYSISERGEYKIKLTNPLGDFGTQNIYLVDHTLNEVINLSENELYTFTSEAGSFADRFEIIYNPRLLSTSELKDVNELVVYLDQKDLNIKSNEKFVGIQVYDLVGNLVKNISNIDETNYTIKLTNNTGVLIVNVKLANGKSVSKKIILK